MPEVRQTVRPRWAFRLPGGAPDGVLRRRGGVLERLLHVGDEPVVVRVAQPARDEVLFGARARDRDDRRRGDRRGCASRSASTTTCGPFHDRFRDDPLIGASVRAPAVAARPPPPRAVGGARVGDHRAADRVRARGRDPAADRVARSAAAAPRPGLRDLPDGGARRGARRRRSCRASTSPPARALALRRAAREVARGRVDLRAADHERGWRRLRAIPGIGRWTVEMLALHGQGRYDRRPGRRPRLPQARRAPRDGQPAGARDRGRGARVLRALRRVGGPRRRPARAARAVLRDRERRRQPLARQELVRQRRAPRRAAA